MLSAVEEVFSFTRVKVAILQFKYDSITSKVPVKLKKVLSANVPKLSKEFIMQNGTFQCCYTLYKWIDGTWIIIITDALKCILLHINVAPAAGGANLNYLTFNLCLFTESF